MDTPITPVPNGTHAPSPGADAAKAAVAKYLAAKLPPAPAQSGTVSQVTQGDKPGVAPTSEAGPTETPPAAGTPEAKTFATVIAQSKRIRELEAAAKAAAGTQPDLLAYQEATKLWETDPLAALGKAFKGDPGELAERLVKFYFAGGDAAPPKTETSPDVTASDNPLAAEVKELKAWKDAREKAEKDAADATARTAVQKKQDEQIDGWLGTLDAAAHPLVLRPENRQDAVAIANAAVLELAKQQGIPMETNDPEIISGLFREGFAIAESQLRELGKRFMLDTSAPAAAPAPEQPKTPIAQIPARTTPKPAATITPSPSVMTIAQAKRKATDDLAAMLSQGRKGR